MKVSGQMEYKFDDSSIRLPIPVATMPGIQTSNMDKSEFINITVSTHNVNGYSRSKEFLHPQCLQSPDSIRAIQEHWLRPPYKKQSGVNQLRHLHPDFDGFGTSAMKKASESKVNVGHPFGGTGFIFNKKFSQCLKPVLNYKFS